MDHNVPVRQLESFLGKYRKLSEILRATQIYPNNGQVNTTDKYKFLHALTDAQHSG